MTATITSLVAAMIAMMIAAPIEDQSINHRSDYYSNDRKLEFIALTKVIARCTNRVPTPGMSATSIRRIHTRRPRATSREMTKMCFETAAALVTASAASAVTAMTMAMKPVFVGNNRMSIQQ